MTTSLGVGLPWLLLGSDLLEVHQVSVRGGLERLSPAMIIEASGLAPGVNMLRVDLEEAKQNILALWPVREVNIRRIYPHQIRIEVQERHPSAIIALDRASYLIDRSGRLLEPVDRPMTDLPLITGVRVTSDAGERQVVEAQMVERFLNLDPDLLSRFRELHLQDPNHTRLYTKGGMEIRLGSVENLWRYLDVIVGTLDRFQYMDLRFDQEVVVRRW